MVFSNPDEVACEPLETASDTITSSISSLASRSDDIKPLTVVFHNIDLGLMQGDKVYMRPEAYTNAVYMKCKYSVGGVKFILIPKSMIILSDRKQY